MKTFMRFCALLLLLSGELFIPVKKISKYNYILCPVPFTHKVWRFPQGNRNDFYIGVVSYLEKRWNDFCKILYSASLQTFVQLYTIPGTLYHRNHALQRHKHFEKRIRCVAAHLSLRFALL